MGAEHAGRKMDNFTGLLKLIQIAAAFVLLPDVGYAQVPGCTVPGTHPTIQAAVNDGSCDSITLGSGTYTESIMIARSLALQGNGAGVTIISGSILASGAGIVVSINGLTVSSGCGVTALLAAGGAQIDAMDTIAQRTATTVCQNGEFLFKDGFESGP